MYVRLASYFDAPAKAEDANSPVGPLQHHVAEPDFNAWESIDWAAHNLGHDQPDEARADTVEPGDEARPGTPNEALYNFGSGYGFACTSPIVDSARGVHVPNHAPHDAC